MSGDIQNRIQNYTSQCKSLLLQLNAIKMSNDAKSQLGDNLVAIGAGALAEDFFGSREAGKIGKSFASKYLKEQQRKQIEANLAQYQTNFDSILMQVREFVSIISLQRLNLDSKGNSYILLGRLAAIQNSPTLRTKLNRMIAFLKRLQTEPLIYNGEIENYLATQTREKEPNSYETLHALEFQLRQLIEKQLSRISGNWWLERIPDDVRQNAELRKAKNERPMPWYSLRKEEPLISFVDFNDYIKIIRRGDNWKQVFKDIFKDEEWISTKLKEIEPVRNAIAHSRSLTKEQRKRLELNAADIARIIRNFS
jgi:hypothetical protein